MFSLVFILRVTFHGIGGWNDTENVIDGSWNRFITVNNPWNGPIAFGPGETKLKARNLCPGLDGRTDHDCRVNITANWIRMVQLAGNGNGGSCDGLYGGRQVNSSCWLNTNNWMNGQLQPTWINHKRGLPGPHELSRALS
eukprot:COSAG01_NODE_13208_length_1620_cov_1.136095_2_plen_140_part_00